MRRMNGTCKRTGAIGLVLTLVPAQGMLRPVAAWASPEFVYSVEKWAVLRDDVLEYGELVDLIHEYNATVIDNRLEHDEYRGKDYGEVKNAYQDIVDGLYDSSDKMMDSVSEDQPGYAGTAVGAISVCLQAEQNQELADSQNEDGRVEKPEYDRQEAALVKDAQTKMTSYQQKAKTCPAPEEDVNQARSGYEAMVVKTGQGMATRAELPGAREKMEVAQAALEIDGREWDGLRRELYIMTGWDYDVWSDTREVPVPDAGEMDQIDLELDKERALGQNFTQSVNERRLTFTGNGSQWDVMNQKVETGRGQIAVDVEAKYKLLEQARIDYGQVAGELELVRTGVQTVERKHSLGMISKNEHTQQQGTTVSSQFACDTAGLKYRQAPEGHGRVINGLVQIEGAQGMAKKCLLFCIGILFACQHPLEVYADVIPDVTRYEESEALVKAYSPQIQMEQAQYDSRLVRYENARGEAMETRRLLRGEAENPEKDNDKGSASQYRAQAKILEDAVKDMDKQIRLAQGSQASMSLRRMGDTVLWTAQNLMGTYNTLKAEQEAALAQTEQKQNQYGKLLRQVQTGGVSAAQADQAGKEAGGAAIRAKAARDEMRRVKKELLILTGHPERSQTEIDPMPIPRPECVREVGGSVDKWRALGNNYSLREQRGGGVSSNKELHARQRNIRQSEEAMYGQLDILYQDVLVSQTLWTSALTSTESQEAAFRIASNKLVLGMLSCQEYLEAKAAYMDATAARERADAGSQQAMDTYDWALKGSMT